MGDRGEEGGGRREEVSNSRDKNTFANRSTYNNNFADIFTKRLEEGVGKTMPGNSEAETRRRTRGAERGEGRRIWRQAAATQDWTL